MTATALLSDQFEPVTKDWRHDHNHRNAHARQRVADMTVVTCLSWDAVLIVFGMGCCVGFMLAIPFARKW